MDDARTYYISTTDGDDILSTFVDNKIKSHLVIFIWDDLE